MIRRSLSCFLETTNAQGGRAQGLVTPSPWQIAWQQLGLTARVSFGINTYTGREVGDGREDPQLFAPTDFDAWQWTRSLKASGVRLLILTAKHQDGFCLWPSRQTEHSVAATPWMEGRGDVVREVAHACRGTGLQFGIHFATCDLHEPSSANVTAYNRFLRAQLRELLTARNIPPAAEYQ